VDGKRRAARLAAMPPEERAAHERWQRSHRPGPSETRHSERERLRQNRTAVELFARATDVPAVNAEASALDDAIRELRQRAARLAQPNVFD
jgi:hypothetical protein